MPKFTHADLIAQGYTYNESTRSYERPEQVSSPVVARVLDAIPKRSAKPSLVGTPSKEGRGKTRYCVRITRYSTRVLDFDNGAGGCKAAIDQLRFFDIIPEDSPEYIDFEFKQVKIKTRKEAGTEIIIERV